MSKRPYDEKRKATAARYYAKWKANASIEDIKQRNRKNTLSKHYKIKPERYESMLKMQNDSCAACGTDVSQEHHGVLCIDHDHVTGQIRALLCGACNRALGHAKEDPIRLRALADYIEEHRR